MDPGEVLGGRYRLQERLDSGGMSVVWTAHDQILDRSVAIKVLAGALATGPAARARIRMEARAAARLSHPNVTNIYDYGEATDPSGACVPYVVMELLRGGTLAQRLAIGPLPPKVALRICSEVAAALAAAHQQHLVHRDIKPANVMLTPSGAKVVDFGIAAVIGQSDDPDGELFGTPAYLAPERLTGDQVMAATDVYAVGLLIYRALTNELPWRAETTTQMLAAHIYVDPAPLPSIDGVPPAVVQLYNRCLAKDPADRPSAGEVAEILAAEAGIVPPPQDDGQAAGHAAVARSSATPSTQAVQTVAVAAAVAGPPGSASDRRRRALVLVGGAAVCAVVAATVALIGPSAEDATPNGTVGNLAASADPSDRQPGSAASATTPSNPRPSASAPRAGDGSKAGNSPGAATPSTTPPAPPGELITARGGRIWLRCDGSNAVVLDAVPATDHTIKDYDPGPAGEVQVVFEASPLESEIKVTCQQGRPVPRVKEGGS